MANLVIMVHSQFSETLLKGLFGKLSFKTIVVPFKNAFLPPENHPAIFKQHVEGESLHESDIDYILIESNYGSPAAESINELLFQHILENCPTAEIFAFSGTPNSLIKALDYHPRINAVFKDSGILSQTAMSNLERMMTLPDMKRMIDPNNRRASAPPMMTPLEDSSILVGSPTRHRSASEPTAFTPYYNAYSGQAAPLNNYASIATPTAPVNNYASTANPTATVTDYTPGTSSDVQKMRF